jgi:hypothetical protein
MTENTSPLTLPSEGIVGEIIVAQEKRTGVRCGMKAVLVSEKQTVDTRTTQAPTSSLTTFPSIFLTQALFEAVEVDIVCRHIDHFVHVHEITSVKMGWEYAQVYVFFASLRGFTHSLIGI